MKQRNKIAIYCLLVFIIIIIFGTRQGITGNIDPDSNDSRFAYGENIGWINFEPTSGPGVAVSDTDLTGYAWAENAGWINMGPTNGGITNDGSGNLSGYAWGENIGWISFSCENTNSCATVYYGVTIDPATGVFDGEAWAENAGWIRFKSTGAVAYGVKTLWQGGGQSSDSDGDGLLDVIENTYCTDPNDADTDNDGILDGDEDINRNAQVDAGETNPCVTDTDNDGIQDGTELGYTLINVSADTDTNEFQPDLDSTTLTDPLDNDSDNDGLLDGQEDRNYNGAIDAGEHDPNLQAPTYNASGLWEYSAYNAWTNCPGGISDSWAGTFILTQVGNSISGIDSNGVKHFGTASLLAYSITTSYPEEGGTTSETHTLILGSRTSGTGTSNWSWTDGTHSCSGGHNVSFIKKKSVLPFLPLLLE